ncbi:DUF3530 family protein [Alkalimonas amylolytica]|uniref:DUF3530 domain-containing protein n=1 Tax=Alkalimonas amylolytica TaxID=152573 RepID=A0A1H3XZ15_ALKAM|nr:DUF3530 family protein [Alkalimonas amylolytica]SEA03792.1 Protein of unknown function [Alkalimonas amylolytica]
MQSFGFVVLMLLLLSGLTATAQTQPNWLQADLQHYLPEWELRLLGEVPNALLVVHREGMTPYQQGTLVLLPDPSQHPASPRQINFLRQAMNEHGWSTVAILPNYPVSSDSATEIDHDETLNHFQQQLQLVLTQQDWQAGHLVILAQGQSGSLLSQLDWAQLPRQPEALVFLSSYHTDPASNRQLAQRIARQTIPVLDLAHHHDHLHIASTFELRRQWSQRHANLMYRQRLLTGHAELETTQQVMYKEVYGWLSYLGL